MKLSTRGKYALYTMVYLAQKAGDGPQSLKGITQNILLPENYIEHLLGSLRRYGLVKTVRGAQGGYELAKPMEEITVGDIFDATEGKLNLSDCLSDDAVPCPKSSSCPTRGVWEYLTCSINKLFNSISLKDMLENNVKEI